MPHVLLAEDNKLNQIVAIGVLQQMQFDIDVVDCGNDAVAACLTNRYDAIIMDVMMPGMDGYQATVTIRDNEQLLGLPRVPIIGLSARAMDGDREIALAAGMDEYLTKPLRTDQLERALSHCAELRHTV